MCRYGTADHNDRPEEHIGPHQPDRPHEHIRPHQHGRSQEHSRPQQQQHDRLARNASTADQHDRPQEYSRTQQYGRRTRTSTADQHGRPARQASTADHRSIADHSSMADQMSDERSCIYSARCRHPQTSKHALTVAPWSACGFKASPPLMVSKIRCRGGTTERLRV